uniref:hypothetical protein n=1 Tax=Flavobacterium sp. TaxID=239 RepID=UPI0037BFE0D5
MKNTYIKTNGVVSLFFSRDGNVDSSIPTFFEYLPNVDILKGLKSDFSLVWYGSPEKLLEILKPLTLTEKFWDKIEFVNTYPTNPDYTGRLTNYLPTNSYEHGKQGYLVYHDNCLDGFLSAATEVMFGGLTMKSDVLPIVVPSNYSDEPVKVSRPGSFIHIVDFSYAMPVLTEYCSNGISIELIDHHKTFVDSFVKYRSEDSQAEFRRVSSPYGPASLFTWMVKPRNDIAPTLSHSTVSHLTITLSDNTYKDKNQIDSGASLTLKKARSANYFFCKNSPVSDELEKIVELAREHDLWLHKGDEMAPSYALSHWFKKFSKRHSATRELMLLFPEISFHLFTKMVEDFFSVPLEDKIDEALKELRVTRERIKALTSSSAVKELKLNIPGYDDVKVLYISSPEINEIGVSIIGSYMVREMGADVA